MRDAAQRETARQKVVVWQGDPNCGAADRGAPALYYANLTWWGEYQWIIMVDDDVLVATENLAAFLSMYDPAMPLWFSAHGCTPAYVPLDRGGAESGEWPHGAPCVAQRAPRGQAASVGRGHGLREACEARGDALTPIDSHGLRGGCAAVRACSACSSESVRRCIVLHGTSLAGSVSCNAPNATCNAASCSAAPCSAPSDAGARRGGAQDLRGRAGPVVLRRHGLRLLCGIPPLLSPVGTA